MENKTCTKCSETKPLNKFRRDNSTKTGYRQPCQVCCNQRLSDWKKTNPDKRNQHQANFNKKLNKKTRLDVLTEYGNKCACCGETEPKFLGIDHIYNDGAKHRREINIKFSSQFYLWLKKNNFPKDRFQLLCHNCNFSKGLYGACPHKKQQ